MEKYKTRQSEILLACLKENSSRALRVDDIIDILKTKGESVGTTTVYRHIDYLVKQGFVRKFAAEDKTGALFQYIHDPAECNEHFHLRCSECGELIHLSCDFMKEMDEHIFEHHGFRVDNSKTVLYGICKNCIERKADK